MQRLIKCGLSVVVAGFILGTWGVAIGAAPSGPDLRAQFFSLVDNEPLPWPVESVQITSNTLVICLDVTPAVLQAAEGLGAEEVEETVARALMPLEWRVLHVLARDPASGECRPLSDFLPRPKPRLTAQETPRLKPAASPEAATFPRSLAGKTVYVSAGHGWQWNGTAWRTQRPPYEEFIEDHNNAEAVAQFLIPYLENAGATVIPVRERDWNAARVIADNEDLTTYTESGSWYTSLITGYAGGSYRFARTVTETATATAAWTLMVPQQGNYALYAWVDSNPNRVRDAHYTIHHAGGSSPVYLDQRIRPETWRYLGTFPCYTGSLTVTLDNHSSVAGDYLIADALRLGGGQFDELAGIGTTAPAPPDKPWWEAATFYYSQWMGLAREEWLYFSDVTARPMYARWQHRGVEEDAIYLSWHTNGYNGHNTVVSGTVSYVYNNSSEYYKRTEGSLELQQAVHEELVHDIRTGWEVGWRDLGERQLNLGEVRMLWDDDPANRMPGVLLEIGYHDNVHDANALKEPRFNRLAARAVYQGVVAYFEEQGSVDLVTAPEPPERLRVQNVGGGGVRIAWQPSLTDTVGLRGEAATGYRVYTSTDGFGWGAPLAVTGTEVTLTG
ncbi:MAG: N-acetylmuramoyl-L-alanine amidase, partial [Chloroflexota bacterium]|nr:N-acetylmuramoyl-L-alanine amidase [Chloroflexota bacterium]